MEFLFYKKKIGAGAESFFKALKSEFDKEYIKTKEKKNYLTALVEAVKEMPSSTKWEALIEKTVKELGGKKKLESLGIDITEGKLKNLNTTALCMLHKNLKGLNNLIRPFRGRRFYSCNLSTIQKFGSKKISRVEELLSERRYYHWPLFEPIEHFQRLKYPNTMLTSDTFLLKEEEINALLLKYKNHWNSFWMIQVPHHGSMYNSNRVFLSQIPFDTSLFINYGTRNKDNHPNPEVISDIVTTGHSSKLVSVNEFTGFKFSLNNLQHH